MPAPKGGTPRKGRLGKKAQLEKIVEASKKTPSKTPQKTTPKRRNVSRQDHTLVQTPLALPNHEVGEISLIRTHNTRLAVGKSSTDPINLDLLREAAEIEAQSIPQLEELASKIATIRLPYQSFKCFPTRRSIPCGQPKQFTIAKPTESKNPNKAIVRLPSTRNPNATTFLSLAQELRNQVYEYAMPRTKYRIQWIPRDDQRPTELTYTLPLNGYKGPNLTAKAGRLRRDFDLPKRAFIDKDMPRYRLSPGPAALLLVSRTVNLDTAPMFYGRNTFSFAAMRPLGKFLANLRPDSLSMVRSLELIHITASNAQLRENQRWKYKNDRLWEKLCFQIRNQCDRLVNLTIDLYIKDLPFKLGPHASWMSSLYAFMGLEHLKHIDVRLHQAEADNAVLEVEAYTVRKALMCDNFYEPIHHTGNKPLLEKPSPRKARPGVNALRVTVGNRRVPASCIKPSLGPRATTFWTPPTPSYSEHDRDVAVINNDNSYKGKGKDVAKPPLTWTPPATLLGTAIQADNKGEGKAFLKFGALINRSLKGKGKAIGTKANAEIKDDGKRSGTGFQNAAGLNRNHFRRMRKALK
ncbi:MAG: hypothetical protein Q9204_001453 [Flavoplaca sp. TL-2023a]